MAQRSSRCSPQRRSLRTWLVAGVAATAELALLGSAGTCELSGGSCICTDESGNAFDVTELTQAANADAETDIVARGPCSGTYCSGSGWEYRMTFCETTTPITSCYSGICCAASDALNMFRLDMRAVCPPGTSCQCEKLGNTARGSLVVTTLDADDGDGIAIEFPADSYYQSYVGWADPIVKIICDPSATDSSYTITTGNTVNPSVVNAVGCTTNYCSAVIEWRTAAICGGGSGWTIVILIFCAAGLYVGGGIGYTRYELGHWDAGDGGVLTAHPHYNMWQQLPALVTDGFNFTKALAQGSDVASAKSVPRDERDAFLDNDDLDVPPPATVGPKKSRRKSEPAQKDKKKKKKKKEKPRPSLPLISTAAEGGSEGKE